MKFFKPVTIAVIILAIAATMGCVNFCRESITGVSPVPTVTPVSTVVPTPTPTPTLPAVNESIEKQYNLVDKFNAGVNEYNAGIVNMNKAQANINGSQWISASDNLLVAKNNMENAKNQFKAMEQFASTTDELNLSAKWYETANYYSITFSYMSQGCIESQNQTMNQTPNYVKERFYFEQASYYNKLAKQSFAEAQDLERKTILKQG
jgi:hypothetical protein